MSDDARRDLWNDLEDPGRTLRAIPVAPATPRPRATAKPGRGPPSNGHDRRTLYVS